MGAVRQNLEAIAASTHMRVEQMHAELSAGLAQFIGAQRIDAARYHPLDPGRPYNGRGRLVGWTVRGVSGTPVINLRNGTTADAQDIVATISLGTGSDWQQDSFWCGPTGIAFTEGLFVELTGGTAAGALYIGAVD